MSKRNTDGLSAEFVHWYYGDDDYPGYPLKDARGAAVKAFDRAIKKTTLAELCEGVVRYRENKPDWKAWKQPATWLNGECWADEYGPERGNMNDLQRSAMYVRWKERYERDPTLVPVSVQKIVGLGPYAKESSA